MNTLPMRELYELSDAAEGGFANTKFSSMAEVANAAYETVLNECKARGLKASNTDAAEEIITNIFAMLCEKN